jgi:hypothetical protein
MMSSHLLASVIIAIASYLVIIVLLSPGYDGISVVVTDSNDSISYSNNTLRHAWDKCMISDDDMCTIILPHMSVIHLNDSLSMFIIQEPKYIEVIGNGATIVGSYYPFISSNSTSYNVKNISTLLISNIIY